MITRTLSVAFATLAFTASVASAQAPASGLSVRVENPIAATRADETIGLSWRALRERLPGLGPERVRVVDAGTGNEIVSQLLDADGDAAPDSLLFQASFEPNQARRFVIEAASASVTMASRAYAKHDDHRDDVAWESDRIAFRIYGQGLWQASEFEPLVSSGVDVWPKRVRDLIVDRWYEKGHDAYHIDTGEGADFYTVGPTLGAGGTAVWRNGELHRARNFKSHRILAAGPVRALFELEYEPWAAAGITVTELKRISIDAGQNLFRQESTFRGAPEIEYAIGTVKRTAIVGSTNRSGAWAWLSTWGPVERKNGGHGSLGTAVLMQRESMIEAGEIADHYIARSTAREGAPTVQYVGAGWTASGDFDSVEDWWAYLDRFAQMLANPLRVTIDTAGGVSSLGR